MGSSQSTGVQFSQSTGAQIQPVNWGASSSMQRNLFTRTNRARFTCRTSQNMHNTSKRLCCRPGITQPSPWNHPAVALESPSRRPGITQPSPLNHQAVFRLNFLLVNFVASVILYYAYNRAGGVIEKKVQTKLRQVLIRLK